MKHHLRQGGCFAIKQARMNTHKKPSSHLRGGSRKNTNPDKQHDPKSKAGSQDKQKGLPRRL